MLIGTAAYLAPEQVSHGVADARTDVYAAGILLFEMLTGQQPHTADAPLAVAYKHVNEAVPVPSQLVDGIPPALDDLVLRATSRNLPPPGGRRPVPAQPERGAAQPAARSPAASRRRLRTPAIRPRQARQPGYRRRVQAPGCPCARLQAPVPARFQILVTGFRLPRPRPPAGGWPAQPPPSQYAMT